MRREERSIGDRGIGSLMHIMAAIVEKSNRMRVNDFGFVKGGYEGSRADTLIMSSYLHLDWLLEYFYSRTSRVYVWGSLIHSEMSVYKAWF